MNINFIGLRFKVLLFLLLGLFLSLNAYSQGDPKLFQSSKLWKSFTLNPKIKK
jgi:hypothetical protein